MTAQPARSLESAFARLAREHPNLGDIDRRLMTAFELLMLGTPEITDGSITVTNICAEAGVSRASYYRSPVAAAVKQILDTPTAPRPEIEELKAEIARLKKEDRQLRSQRAAEIRELADTTTTYANHIQVLTLRNAELEEENKRLRRGLEQAGNNITQLNDHR